MARSLAGETLLRIPFAKIQNLIKSSKYFPSASLASEKSLVKKKRKIIFAAEVGEVFVAAAAIGADWWNRITFTFLSLIYVVRYSMDTVPFGPFVLLALDDGRKVLLGADNPILHFGSRPYCIFLLYIHITIR